MARAVRRAIQEHGFEPVESSWAELSRREKEILERIFEKLRVSTVHRRAWRMSGGRFQPWEIVLWAGDEIAANVALALGAAVACAIRHRRDRQRNLRRSGTVRVVYGPDTTELANVKVPPESE